MSNEIEIVVTKKDKAQLDQLGRDAKKAGQDVGDGLKKGFREGEDAGDRMRKKVGQDLDQTAKDAKEAGGKAGHEFGTQFGDNVQGVVGGQAEDIIGGFLEQAKGAGGIAAAGAGIGALLLTGIAGGLEEGNVGGLLAAQIAGVGGESGRLGKLAGKVYADNFGDSLEEAAGGIKAIMQNKLIDPHATDEAIRTMTGMVLTASKVVEEEANNVARAARQLLVNGLAESSEEAFDIIVAASQRGLNVNEDLIDTTVEYSTKFRDLGLSGQEAMGLIGQAMDAGARDIDTAADALKEFSIRGQDGSESTVRGFEAIGLNAERMGLDIAAGGDRAHDALSRTLVGLKSIENPVQRNQAAVDLFGTKAEDLGDALFNMDLETVAAQFGDVAGATDSAANSMVTAGAKAEGFFRQMKKGATDATGWLVSGFKSVFGGNSQDLMDLVVSTGDYTDAVEENREAQKLRVREAASAWTKERDSIIKTTKSLAEHIQMQEDAMGVVVGIAEAEIRYQKSLDDSAESLKKNKKTLDINTEAGRENKEALLSQAEAAYDQIKAMEKQGATTDQVRQFMGGARAEFVKMATDMGMSAVEANKLADKLRLIPGTYSASVGVVDAGASNTIQTIRGHLVNLTNRQWIASVAVTGTGINGGGRYFAGLAHGGPVGAGIQHAAEGGPRGQMVMTQEQGPEIGMWPDGSMIIPAGMSRQIMAGAFGGGGRGGDVAAQVDVHFTGNLDSAFAAAFMKLYNLGMIRIGAR